MSAGDLSLSCLSVLMHAHVCVCVGFYVGAGNLKEVRGRAFYAGRATTSCYRGSHAVRTSWLKLLSSLLCVSVCICACVLCSKREQTFFRAATVLGPRGADAILVSQCSKWPAWTSVMWHSGLC